MERIELRTHIKFIYTHVHEFEETPHNNVLWALCGVTEYSI